MCSHNRLTLWLKAWFALRLHPALMIPEMGPTQAERTDRANNFYFSWQDDEPISFNVCLITQGRVIIKWVKIFANINSLTSDQHDVLWLWTSTWKFTVYLLVSHDLLRSWPMWNFMDSPPRSRLILVTPNKPCQSLHVDEYTNDCIRNADAPCYPPDKS